MTYVKMKEHGVSFAPIEWSASESKKQGYKPLFIDEVPADGSQHLDTYFTDEGTHIQEHWRILNEPMLTAPRMMVPIYDSETKYNKGEVVDCGGAYYRLKTERARGINPTDKTYWENISLTDLIKEISKENEQ